MIKLLVFNTLLWAAGIQMYHDVPPSFPGGEKVFKMFVDEFLIYPEHARMEFKEGLVQVTLQLDEEGKVKVYRFQDGDPLLQQAVVDLIDKMPNWKPAIRKGVAVPSKVSIGVEFALAD